MYLSVNCGDSCCIDWLLNLVWPFIVIDSIVFLSSANIVFIFILFALLIFVDRGVLSPTSALVDRFEVEIAHDAVRTLVALQLEALMVLNHSCRSTIVERHNTTASIVLFLSCWSLCNGRRCFHLT